MTDNVCAYLRGLRITIALPPKKQPAVERARGTSVPHFINLLLSYTRYVEIAWWDEGLDMTRDIGIAFLCSMVTLFVVVDSKVCTSLDIRNSLSNLNRLQNCTTINGYLRINLLESATAPEDFDKYVYPDLTEITGYLVLYKVSHLTSVGKILPNLRVIRGISLIFDYALAIHSMPHLVEVSF